MAMMYNIQDVPGEGRGLFATRDIPKGTTIIEESNMFEYQVQPLKKNKRKVGETTVDAFFRYQLNPKQELLENDIAKLSHINRNRFDLLTDQGKREKVIYWRVRSNAFTTFGNIIRV